MGIRDISLEDILTTKQVREVSAYMEQLKTDGVRPLSAEYTRRLIEQCGKYKSHLLTKGKTPEWVCYFLIYRMYADKEK